MNAVKKRFTSGSSNIGSPTKEDLRTVSTNFDDVSPELVPIVTLLSSQSHRRYYEGIFMLYYDLNGDGKPADREWKEVYGILTGNQLAYWDAANLASFKNNNNPNALLENTSKPNYINFTDSVYNAMKSLPAAKQNLDNVIIVSTTLKNRYIIQFKTLSDLNNWYLGLRLSNFEYQCLQHAYTAALLSARGSRLSDIKTILAEKRFDHEDWVSIRYGSGMAWKRCYAVVEPSSSKRKAFTPGRILFYENDQKKKKQLMAVVTNCSSVSAVYPQSHQLIDHSTMLKLEGYINFKSPTLSTKVSKKSIDDFKNTSIFLMPENHSSVPGFDTLIRFLIPLLDSFGLYGRPKRLKAERGDPDSLLFGLPTLPHVHYLELSDLQSFISKADFFSWDVKSWNTNLKSILKTKIDQGYEGCGSARGFAGALNSLNSPLTPNSSTFNGSPKMPQKSQFSQPANGGSQLPPPPPNKSEIRNVSNSSNSSVVFNPNKNVNNLSLPPPNDHHKSIELADIYQKYQDIKSPSDRFNSDRNEILNGSSESIDEDHLPENVRKVNLSENMYPTDDHDLFSDDDEDAEEEESLSLSGSDKFDSRQIGMASHSDNNLGVPAYNNRNSSYSSVQSPTTQYNEFNESFQAIVSPKNQRPVQFPTRDIHNFSHFSDEESDSGSPPPVPPPHTLNSSPYRPNRIHKPNYISHPNEPSSSSEELSGFQVQPPPPQAIPSIPPSQSFQPPPQNYQQQYQQPRNSPPPQGHQSRPVPPQQPQQQSRPVPVQTHQGPQAVAPLNQKTYNNPNTYQMAQMQQGNQMRHQPQPQQQQHQPPQQQYGRPAPQPMNTGIPPSTSQEYGHKPMSRRPPQNYGVPPSASFNQAQSPNQPMHPYKLVPQQGSVHQPPPPQQMYQQPPQQQQQYPPQNRQEPPANMRNYGGQYQYQYQPQPPKPNQPQQQQQKPNPFTRQY